MSRIFARNIRKRPIGYVFECVQNDLSEMFSD